MNDINHTERFHARMSASKIPSLALCLGKLNAESALPEEPAGEAAARGTAIHEIAEALYEGAALPDDTPADLVKVAQKYVDTLRQMTVGCKRTIIEMDVTDALSSVHPSLGGTADFVGIGGNALTVVDLKTGRVEVSPENNLQLMTYALGAAIALKAPPGIYVRLAIYQPECGGWKEWGCSYADLMDWKESLRKLAKAASEPTAPRTPSTDACRYCRAKAVCPELRSKAVAAAAVEFKVNKENRVLSPEVTGEMLEQAELCATWAEAVQGAAKTQLINKPGSIEGWRLRDGRKMVKWRDGQMARALLADKIECWDLKSPSAVKALGVEVPPSLIEETRVSASLVREK